MEDSINFIGKLIKEFIQFILDNVQKRYYYTPTTKTEKGSFKKYAICNITKIARYQGINLLKNDTRNCLSQDLSLQLERQLQINTLITVDRGNTSPINYLVMTFANSNDAFPSMVGDQILGKKTQKLVELHVLPFPYSSSSLCFLFTVFNYSVKVHCSFYSYIKINEKKNLKQLMNVNWGNLAKSQNNSWYIQRRH